MICLTKEEIKLQSKISKQNEQILKLEEKLKNKKIEIPKRRKLPMSASHLTLYIILTVYLITALFGIFISLKLSKEHPEFTVQILIALFSFVGVCGTGTIGFYTNKASKENELEANNRRFDTYINKIEKMSEKISKGEISQEGMMWFNILRQDSNTTISTNGFGGITTVDNTNFSSPNINSNTLNPPDISIPINDTDITDINVKS